MAEMYGEVMELNERLHKDIATKDKSIESMTARLRKAGLEVRVHVTSYRIHAICQNFCRILILCYIARHGTTFKFQTPNFIIVPIIDLIIIQASPISPSRRQSNATDQRK